MQYFKINIVLEWNMEPVLKGDMGTQFMLELPSCCKETPTSSCERFLNEVIDQSDRYLYTIRWTLHPKCL